MVNVGDTGAIVKKQYLPEGGAGEGDNAVVLSAFGETRVFTGTPNEGDTVKVITIRGRRYVISPEGPYYLWYFYTAQDPDETITWQKIRLASGLDPEHCFPKCYIDNNDLPHVFWMTHGETAIYHRWNDGTKWNKEKISILNGYKCWSTNPRSLAVCIDAANTLHIAVYCFTGTTWENYRQYLFYFKKVAGGEWTKQELMYSQPSGSGHFPFPNVSIDRDSGGSLYAMTLGLPFGSNVYMYVSGGAWVNTTINKPPGVSYRCFAVSKSSKRMERFAFYLRIGDYYFLRCAHGWGTSWIRDGIDYRDFIHVNDLNRAYMDLGYTATVRRTVGEYLGGIWINAWGSGTGVVTYYPGFMVEEIAYGGLNNLDVITLINGLGDWKHYSVRVNQNIYYNYLNVGTLEYHYSKLVSDGYGQHFDIDSTQKPHFAILTASKSYD